MTLVRQVVNVMSVGQDGKANTADDFQVANYSILVSDQSAGDPAPRPAPAEMSLSENTGAILGSVFDLSGAVIPNAEVEATREGTDQKHAVKSDAGRRFELKDSQPGVYDIVARSQGFQALEVKALLVQANSVTEVSSGGSSFSFRFRPRFAMHAETAPSLLYDYYNPDASVTLEPTRFDVSQGKED